MSKRDRAILSGALLGGLLGGAVAYLFAPPREPGEEGQTSLLSNIGIVEVLALTKAALGFVRQLDSVQKKGARRWGGRAS